MLINFHFLVPESLHTILVKNGPVVSEQKASCNFHIVVDVLGFYFPPTTKVKQRRDLGLKSHPKDRRSPGLIVIFICK